MPSGQGSTRFLFDSNGYLYVNNQGGGGTTGNVNITEVAGNTVAATTAAALPVELFDGTNPLGVSGNPLYDNLAQVGGNAVATGATGLLKVAIVGNAGAVLDAAPGSGAPTNALQIGGTDGTDIRALLTDANGQLKTLAGGAAESTASWNSGTAQNTTLQVNCAGYGIVVITLNDVGTVTPGVLTFESSDTTAFSVAYTCIITQLDKLGQGSATQLTLVSSTNVAYYANISGWAAFRVRLSTAITGSGTVNLGLTLTNQVNPNVVGQVASVVTAGVRSTLAAVTPPGDNATSGNIFSSSANAAGPLYVGDALYGGAFSGTANAALQGYSKARTPTIFKTVQATASGNTGIWTPGTGNKFRLLKLQVIVTDAAYLASAGTFTVSFQDATSAIGPAYDISLLGSALVNPDGVLYDSGWIDLGFFGILSAAANNALNVNLSAALSAGNVRVNVAGTEE